jgi:hypothetical protein
MTASPPSTASEPILSPAVAQALRPGQSVALLQQLHILTREGQLNQDSRRKLKQVYHLFQFIEKLLVDIEADLPPGPHGLAVADHGAGKSYLGFILYDLFFKARDRGWVYGVETRPELVESARQLAQRCGFGRMGFVNLSVAESIGSELLPAQIDLVTALHACDSATDDAIAFGLAKKARAMALVPCCQAEAARHLGGNRALMLGRTPLAELWCHPLHAREMGSQITNVMRCLYLQAQGYQVTVTELVGWEHSMKNELIIARYTGQKMRSAAQRLTDIAEQFGLETLLDTRFTLPIDNP